MKLLLLLLVLMVLLGGATDRSPDRNPDPPDTHVGRQMAWVLRVLNGEEALGDLGARFDPRFIETQTPARLSRTLSTLRERSFAGRPIDLVEIHREENDYALTGIIKARGSGFVLSMFITVDEKSGLIAGLYFDRAGYSCAAGDWESYTDELNGTRGNIGFSACEIIRDGTSEDAAALRLRPVYEFHEREPLAVGTAFRLWVLAALAREIDASRLSWDREVPIRDELKATPFSPTARLPSDSRITILELARRAMTDNDSTASDHLLAVAGRDTVEALVRELGHEVGPIFPVLTVREMLALKLHPDPQTLATYAIAPADERRRLLRDGPASRRPAWEGLEAWSSPRALATVGWPLSTRDQCRVLLELRRLEQRKGLAQIADATGTSHENLPFRLDPLRWPEVRFIEGIEPGVISFAILLRRADDRWYALAMTWNDNDGNTDETRFAEVARAGIAILNADR
jgi:hypothetical protein